jgi:hypothetical protein
MAQYVALLYYDRDQYWNVPPESELSPEYTAFARRSPLPGWPPGATSGPGCCT